MGAGRWYSLVLQAASEGCLESYAEGHDIRDWGRRVYAWRRDACIRSAVFCDIEPFEDFSDHAANRKRRLCAGRRIVYGPAVDRARAFADARRSGVAGYL